MIELWRTIPNFEDRYSISNLGRVRSEAFMQRYVLRNGKEGFRRTRERLLAFVPINSGYLSVHLWLHNRRFAYLVHRLVAAAFLPDAPLDEVNHDDGDKHNNAATNLVWATSQENKYHAVRTGLNSQAIPCIGPAGEWFPSIAQAAIKYGKRARKFERGAVCQ